ncbi:hypothetical protein EniLVp02_0156 [Vibrio phage EniLVp02]
MPVFWGRCNGLHTVLGFWLRKRYRQRYPFIRTVTPIKYCVVD